MTVSEANNKVAPVSEGTELGCVGRCKPPGGFGAQPRKILKFGVLCTSTMPIFDTLDTRIN